MSWSVLMGLVLVLGIALLAGRAGRGEVRGLLARVR